LIEAIDRLSLLSIYPGVCAVVSQALPWRREVRRPGQVSRVFSINVDGIFNLAASCSNVCGWLCRTQISCSYRDFVIRLIWRSTTGQSYSTAIPWVSGTIEQSF